MRKPRLGRIAGIALVLAFSLIAHPANAQFSNATGKVAGTAGQACVSATNDYAWPDTNGNILKCVSNVWTIQGVTATAAGSTGYVQFNSSGAFGADSNFFWDNTNKRVGIGTTAPATSLDLSAESDGLKLQTIAAAAGASCTSTYQGAIRYNSTSNNVEFCNGTNWSFLAAGASSCGAPSGLSFTNQTGVALSTMTISNSATITWSGCSSAEAVSVTGGGSPQISINGGAWGTTGAIYSGQTLQAKLTSSALASTLLTATVTVGVSNTYWTVTTAASCIVTIGTVCADGSIYAGITPDTSVPMYAAPCDYGMTGSAGSCTGTRGQTYWSVGNSATGINSWVTGRANTLALHNDDGKGNGPYEAADWCYNLSGYLGHSDWYLPAEGELDLLYQGYSAIGGFSSGAQYWSSSENGGYTPNAFYETLSSGGQGPAPKGYSYDVRCVRR